jgi:4-diphosphocytidyl-2-C-methyl-D-erythritol kinase
LLNRLHALALSADELAAVGATIGSDVPFFMYGGTALVGGRGERVRPLPDAPVAWVVLLVPLGQIEEKTKRIYEAMTELDHTDGGYTKALAKSMRNKHCIRAEDIHNAFDRVAYEMFGGLERHREAMLKAGGTAAHLAGAGPGLFAFAESKEVANEVADRVQGTELKVFVVSTLGADKAATVAD